MDTLDIFVLFVLFANILICIGVFVRLSIMPAVTARLLKSERQKARNQVHCMPQEKGHEPTPQCWCHPVQDEVAPLLWIHKDVTQ